MNFEDRINELQNEFRTNLDQIDKFVFGTTLSYAFFQDRYSEFLKDYKANDEEMKLFTELNSNIPEYTSEVYILALINSIARTEAYLNDILATLYIWKKESLISNKTLTYKEIIECQTIDDLIKEIRNKELLLFSHSSFQEKVDFLKSKFKLSFEKINDKMNDIIELFTTRNIILHNNGIINETYLKINKNCDFILGDKRTIDKDYSHKAIVLLMLVGLSVGDSVLKKIKS